MSTFRLAKALLGCTVLAILLGLYWSPQRGQLTADELLISLERRCFTYFLDHQYPETGLVADGSAWEPASTSATGFGLSALVIGTERGWISRQNARGRALTALQTCVKLINESNTVSSYYGFLYHFMDGNTGARLRKAGFQSEISIIDMAILIAGGLAAGEYFGGEVREAAEELYGLVQWDKFLDTRVDQFFGAWTPEQGFSSWHWGYYTDEIILISLLAIGSPTYAVKPQTFYAWERVPEIVSGESFIRSWSGGLFTYQLAHLWLDLQGLVDKEGVDWWMNSRIATLANRALCIKYADVFVSYGNNSWGVTPCFNPQSVRQYGGMLSLMANGGRKPYQDGTIAPSAAAGSLFLTPEYSRQALLHYYQRIPRIWGQYGFKSSFNLDCHWVAPLYYAIELGITILAIDNYRFGTVQQSFARSPFIKKALQEAGFREGI